MTYQQASEKVYTDTEKISEQSEKEIVSTYNKTFKEIDNTTQNYYSKMRDSGAKPEEYYDYSTKHGRLDKLISVLTGTYLVGARKSHKTQIDDGYKTTSNAFYQNRYLQTYIAEMKFRFYNPTVQTTTITGSTKAWESVGKSVRERIALNWGGINQYYPNYGTLAEILAKNDQETITALDNLITQGLRNGDTYKKTSREIRDLLNTTTNNAVRIARTERARNINAAKLATNEVLKSQGVETERVWVATLDNRTRPTHAQADGQRENEDGLFRVGTSVGTAPGNMSEAKESINCRCTTIDVIEDVTPQTRTAKDPVTGKVRAIDYKNYTTWAKENGLRWNQNRGWVPK